MIEIILIVLALVVMAAIGLVSGSCIERAAAAQREEKSYRKAGERR